MAVAVVWGDLLPPVMRFAPLLLLVLVACDSSSNTLAVDPVGHWPLDTQAVKDATPAQNDGEAFGATTAPGAVGRSLAFDGNGSYARIPHSPAYDTDEMTVSFWIRKTNDTIRDTPFNAFDLEGLVWKSFDTRVERTFSISMRGRTAPFEIYGSTGTDETGITTVATDYVVEPGRWYHVALVLTPSSISISLDGALSETAPTEAPFPLDDAPITIGSASADSFPARFLVGQVDELRVYDRALSPEEILVLASR